LREHLTPQEQLTDIVTEAIRKKKETLSTYSAAGKRIDSLVSEDVLHCFDHLTVIVVAAEMGFEYDVCDYGCAHPNRRARANGQWVDLPDGVDADLYRKHRHQADMIICPACAVSYRSSVMQEALKVHNLLHSEQNRYS
jgi:hypothetical protein